MTRTKVLFVVLIMCCLRPVSMAQISNGGVPLSWKFPLKSAIFQHVVSINSTKKNGLSYNRNGFLKSLQIAQTVDLGINIINSGVWTQMPDGSKICRMRFSSIQAKAMICYFNVFEPVVGSNLYIYSFDRKVLLGSYNENSCGVKGTLAVVPIPGNDIVIEYSIPPYSKNLGRVTLSSIDIDLDGKTLINKAGEADCFVNTVCAQAVDWQNEVNAVVRLTTKTSEGTLLCTGVLVNNTSDVNKFYILTANHCVSTKEQAANTIAYFNYEGANCNAKEPEQINSLSGTSLIATYQPLDFTLLELNKLPFEYHPFMAGWDTNDQKGSQFAIIHHPEGWVKKITLSYNPVEISTYAGFLNKAFLSVNWSESSTAEGSSGGPLFNSSHQVIGSLTGGFASCSDTRADYFSRLALSYNYNEDSISQLKCWVDSANRNVKSYPGRYAYNRNKEGYSFYTNMQSTENNNYQQYNTTYLSSSHNNAKGIAEVFNLTQLHKYRGFYIVPAHVTHHNSKSKIKFELHQDGFWGDTIIFNKSMVIDSFSSYKPHFISFDSELLLSKKTTLYILYDAVSQEDTMSVAHATFRNYDNTAYSIQNNNLKSFTELYGNEYATSLAIWLKSTIDDVNLPSNKTSTIIYSPNPSNEGKFNIQFDSWTRPIYLTVNDLTGKLVYKQTIKSEFEPFNLDLSYLQNGIYIATAKSVDKTNVTKLLILK